MKPSIINEEKVMRFQEKIARKLRYKISRLTAKLVCVFIQLFKGTCIGTNLIKNPNEQTRTVKHKQAGVC